ncbi:MAG: cytochrome b/b6 domain-containing protein [Pseudomonadota bacterium]
MALQEDLKHQGDFLFRYRSYLPLVLFALGLWVKIYQERFNGLASEGLVGEVLEGAALAVGLFGLAVRVATVGFTPDNTSGRNTGAGQLADVLNTTGAYSMTRNPLYLGNYFMWIAVAMTTGNIWFVCVFSLAFWIFYERIVFAEESFLRKKFGSPYLAWAVRTPAFLPAFSKYVAPSRRFSWRKVLRQEKNGLFALLLVLCVFGLVGDVAEDEFSLYEERLSIAGAVFAAMVYSFLKLLKKRTLILSDSPRTTGHAPVDVIQHSLLARAFHWGFVVVLAYALVTPVDEVVELDDTVFLLKETVFAVFFLVLLLARFVYMRTQPSALRNHTPVAIRRLARIVHLGMYGSLGLLAVSGLAIGGLHAAGLDESAVFAVTMWLHEAVYWSSVTLIAVHIVGAIYHRYLGDGVWSSMVPLFVEKSNRPPTA